MPKTNLKVISGKGKSNVEDDIDALFRLPLSDFIGARKTLTAKLKQEGRGHEAARINALGKPSVSAWTVNQLFWQQRESFDQLIATGQRLRQAQTKSRTSKPVDLRAAFDERRELLAQLSDLAAAVLVDAGHNPALDTLRRIATTLEAMSAYASLPEGVSAGRLTKDIDPPGFDSLAGFAASASLTQKASPPVRPPIKSSRVETKTQQRTLAADANRLKKERQAKLAATKLWVQQSKRSMAAALARAKSIEASQKKAEAETKEAEKRRREAERRLKDASAAAEAASRRSEKMAVELQQARESLREATRAAEEASAELEALFRES